MEKDNKIKNILIITLIGIIIIALLAVIFLPGMITKNRNERKEEFQYSSIILADYIEKQYLDVKNGGENKTFSEICTKEETGNGSNYCNNIYEYKEKDRKKISDKKLKTLLFEAGLNSKNFSEVKIILINGRACAILNSSVDGKYKKVENIETISVACNREEFKDILYGEEVEGE